MPSRLDWLAIAILSGLVARWVSKHEIGEDGKMGEMKEPDSMHGIAVNYSTLTQSYAVPEPRLNSTFKSLAENKLIRCNRVGDQLYVMPVTDAVERLFNHPVAPETTVTMKAGPANVLFSGVELVKENFPSANAWLIDRFVKSYQQHRKATYQFKSGRDAKAVKCLLRAMGIMGMQSLNHSKIKEVDRIFEFYLTEKGREYFTGGYAMHGLWDNWAAIQCRLATIAQPEKRLCAQAYDANGKSKSSFFY